MMTSAGLLTVMWGPAQCVQCTGSTFKASMLSNTLWDSFEKGEPTRPSLSDFSQAHPAY